MALIYRESAPAGLLADFVQEAFDGNLNLLVCFVCAGGDLRLDLAYTILAYIGYLLDLFDQMRGLLGSGRDL